MNADQQNGTVQTSDMQCGTVRLLCVTHSDKETCITILSDINTSWASPEGPENCQKQGNHNSVSGHTSC